MKQFTGVPSSPGYAIGPVHRFRSLTRDIAPTRTSDPQAELRRCQAAVEQARRQLETLYQSVLQRVSPEEAEIFRIHADLLLDPDLDECRTAAILGEGYCAEYAVHSAGLQFAQLFSSLESPQLRERAADIRDITQRTLSILCGAEGEAMPPPSHPYILYAEDLVPSETVSLVPERVLAILTEKGSPSSHSAILARSMGIPSVAGLPSLPVEEGGLLAVDGGTGAVLVEPDLEAQAWYAERIARQAAEQAELAQLRTLPSVTAGGQTIQLFANIGRPSDLQAVLSCGAEGVGLFRSEFLYMDADAFPSEDAQYRAYRHVLEGMEGRQVIIRTLDLGSDKSVPYFSMPREENPALGCRAVRLCLQMPELFRTQLRALLHAGVHGNLGIMIPMISSVEQVRQCRTLLKEAEASLQAEGIPYSRSYSLGIMIETPAAALISSQLAQEVDFFSIGTNDLTQYTLAVDRMNSALAPLYAPDHPAVLQLIQMTAEHAHKAGIPVGICGESAADPALLPFYLSIGIDELSVAPSRLLSLRRLVRETSLPSLGHGAAGSAG